PEYGTANGRLHFHAVHFMRTLPTGSVDPNFGRRVRNRRQLNSLQNTWPYGYSMPIAVPSSWKRFCLFVCRALSSIMVICMLTAIRLLLTFVMSLYLLLRS